MIYSMETKTSQVSVSFDLGNMNSVVMVKEGLKEPLCMGPNEKEGPFETALYVDCTGREFSGSQDEEHMSCFKPLFNLKRPEEASEDVRQYLRFNKYELEMHKGRLVMKLVTKGIRVYPDEAMRAFLVFLKKQVLDYNSDLLKNPNVKLCITASMPVVATVDAIKEFKALIQDIWSTYEGVKSMAEINVTIIYEPFAAVLHMLHEPNAPVVNLGQTILFQLFDVGHITAHLILVAVTMTGDGLIFRVVMNEGATAGSFQQTLAVRRGLAKHLEIKQGALYADGSPVPQDVIDLSKTLLDNVPMDEFDRIKEWNGAYIKGSTTGEPGSLLNAHGAPRFKDILRTRMELGRQLQQATQPHLSVAALKALIEPGNKPLKDTLARHNAARCTILQRYSSNAAAVVTCPVGGGTFCYGVSALIQRALQQGLPETVVRLQMRPAKILQVAGGCLTFGMLQARAHDPRMDSKAFYQLGVTYVKEEEVENNAGGQQAIERVHLLMPEMGLQLPYTIQSDKVLVTHRVRDFVKGEADELACSLGHKYCMALRFVESIVPMTEGMLVSAVQPPPVFYECLVSVMQKVDGKTFKLTGVVTENGPSFNSRVAQQKKQGVAICRQPGMRLSEGLTPTNVPASPPAVEPQEALSPIPSAAAGMAAAASGEELARSSPATRQQQQGVVSRSRSAAAPDVAAAVGKRRAEQSLVEQGRGAAARQDLEQGEGDVAGGSSARQVRRTEQRPVTGNQADPKGVFVRLADFTRTQQVQVQAGTIHINDFAAAAGVAAAVPAAVLIGSQQNQSDQTAVRRVRPRKAPSPKRNC